MKLVQVLHFQFRIDSAVDCDYIEEEYSGSTTIQPEGILMEDVIEDVIQTQGTRRRRRRARPVLKVGDQNITGRVAQYNPHISCGFIQPDNGAKWIAFTAMDADHDTHHLLAVGYKATFFVQEAPYVKVKGKNKRKKLKNARDVRLTAHIM